MEEEGSLLNLSPAVLALNLKSDSFQISSPKLCGILKTPNTSSSVNHKLFSSDSSSSTKRVAISVEKKISSCRRISSCSPFDILSTSILKSSRKRRKRLNNLSLEALLDHDVLFEWCDDMATPPKGIQSETCNELIKKEIKKNVARVLFDVPKIDEYSLIAKAGLNKSYSEFDNCYQNLSSSSTSPTLFKGKSEEKKKYSSQIDCLDMDYDFNSSNTSREYVNANTSNQICSPTMVFEKSDRYSTNITLGKDSLSVTKEERKERKSKFCKHEELKVVLPKTINKNDDFLSPSVLSEQKNHRDIISETSYELISLSQSSPKYQNETENGSLNSSKDCKNTSLYNLDGDENLWSENSCLSHNHADDILKQKETQSKGLCLNLTNEFSNCSELSSTSTNDVKEFLSPPMTGGFKSPPMTGGFLLTGVWNCSKFSDSNILNNVSDNNFMNLPNKKSLNSTTDFKESYCGDNKAYISINQNNCPYVDKFQALNNENVSKEIANKHIEKFSYSSVKISDTLKLNTNNSLELSTKSICTDNNENILHKSLQACSNQITPINNMAHQDPNLRGKKFLYPTYEITKTGFQSFLHDQNMLAQKNETEEKHTKKLPSLLEVRQNKNNSKLSDEFIDMDILTQIPAEDINSQQIQINNTKTRALDKSLHIKMFVEDKNTLSKVPENVFCERDSSIKYFSNFQTPLGKNVKVTEKYFPKVLTSVAEDSSLKKFQNNVGKVIEVSERSLQAAKKLFDEENNDTKEDNKMTGFGGFQTGLGKKVEISEKSLQAAKKLFQEENNDTKEENTMTGFGGFQTGLGKKVEISEKSLQAAKKLFQEENNNTIEDNTMTGFGGFQTGLGKKVEVSEKSLQTAKRLFQEEIIRRNDTMKENTMTGFGGFQTGLGKKVEVSEKSLQTAKKLFQEEIIRRNDTIEENAMTGFGGFQTGLGKKVEISEKSLQAAKVYQEENVYGILSKTSPPLYKKNSVAERGEKSYLESDLVSLKLHKRKIKFSSIDAYEHDRDAKFLLPLIPIFTSPDDTFDKCSKVVSFDENLKPLKNSSFTTPFKAKASSTESFSEMKTSSEMTSFCPFQKKRKLGFYPNETKDVVYQKQIGRLYLSKKKSCKSLVNLHAPTKLSRAKLYSYGIKDQVIDLNPLNSLNFQFHADNYFSGSVLHSKQVIVGDGIRLQFNEEMDITISEFKQALLGCSGIDKNLINDAWIENHYKWIVWKLASYERMYPDQNAGRCLTPSNVMYQLKYRYDKEIENLERSCLKCICERDDVPTRRIVLCVSSCRSEYGNTIWLTDGWYEIKASLDSILSQFVDQGKIAIGTKLCIYGAELVGSEKACPPLEISETLMLKLSANSTRRACWYAKLGYQKEKVAFPLSLKSLYADGGIVGCVKVLILRKYPMQWMEKVGGRCLFRNFVAEEQVKKKYEEEKCSKMEQLYDQLKRELEMKKEKKVAKKKSINIHNIKLLRSGREIFEAIDDAPDPTALEHLLSDSQKSLVIEYKQNLSEQFQSDLKRKFEEEWKKSEFQERSTVQLQRFRVQCKCPKNQSLSQNTILTVWKPTSDINEQWNEGIQLSIYNLCSAKNRYKHISCKVQLSTTHTSRYFVHEKEANQNFLYRKIYSIADLSRMAKIPYNEIDVVGFVIKIYPEKNTLGVDQTLYICDDASKQFLSIKFYGGLKAYSVENIIKENHLVVLSSLTWDHSDKSYPAKTIFCIYSDLSFASNNLSPTYMSKAVKRCKDFIEMQPSFLQEMRIYLNEVLNSKKCFPVNSTPKRGLLTENIAMDDVISPITLPTEKLSNRHRLQIKKRLSLERYREPKALSVLQANDHYVLRAEFKPPSVVARTPFQKSRETSSKTV